MMILYDDRTSPAATSRLLGCPECDGEGVIRTNVARDPATGVWDCDEQPCAWCEGSGQVELLRCQGVECPVWFDPRDQLCAHGEPVCDEHRYECSECMLDAKDAS